MGKNWKWSQLFSTPGRIEYGVFRDGTTIICDPTHVPNNIDRSHQLNAEPNTKCVLCDSLYVMCRMAKLTHDDRGQGWSHLGDVELVPGRWCEGGSGQRSVFLVIWVLTSWVYTICKRDRWAPGWLYFSLLHLQERISKSLSFTTLQHQRNVPVALFLLCWPGKQVLGTAVGRISDGVHTALNQCPSQVERKQRKWGCF